MLTGLRPNTYKKLQLNAGLFLKNFSYSTATDATSLKTLIASAIEAETSLLGATRGGGSLEVTPTIRQVEADGARSAFVGGEINDGWTVKMKGTLLEITPANFAAALMSADAVTSGNITTVTIRTEISEDDYIDSLVWVGDLADGRCVLIDLKNALNTVGANFTFTDKGEGTLPFEFEAHQDDVLEQDTAPVKLLFFEKATTPPGPDDPEET